MEIEKNTVPAHGQLPTDEHISFEGLENGGVKIAFVGNSITRHGKAPHIGWNGDWGMAASSKERDYVHRGLKGLEQRQIAASACICNGSEWEQHYKTDFDLDFFKEVKWFQPDFLIMRLVENCAVQEFDSERFEKAYEKLIQYLISDNTKVILTTGFWKHPGDAVIQKIAEKKNYPCIYLGELGEMESMKAIGCFEHTGVAAHPGDAGMERIAQELLTRIEKVLACDQENNINMEA